MPRNYIPTELEKQHSRNRRRVSENPNPSQNCPMSGPPDDDNSENESPYISKK